MDEVLLAFTVLLVAGSAGACGYYYKARSVADVKKDVDELFQLSADPLPVSFTHMARPRNDEVWSSTGRQ